MLIADGRLFERGLLRFLWFRSVCIVVVGWDGMTGMYFLGNFLLRVDIRPEPSILTTYWSYCLTSIIVPVLSHFVGWAPIWFSTLTLSPTFRDVSHLVCSDHLSTVHMCLFLRASSHVFRVSHQVLCEVSCPRSIGIKSLVGLPNMHSAGDSLVSLSGQFLYCSIARWNLLVSSSPLLPQLSIILLIVFTPTSPLQLLRGKATDESQ